MSRALHPFFEQFDPVISARIHIPEGREAITQEIHENCVYVSVTSELAREIPAADFLAFLDRVKADRRQQLAQSGIKTDLCYYSWHDEQAGQFRFNFIRADHERLPFGAPIRLVDNESLIVEDFLKSPYLDGIPWPELEAGEGNEEASQGPLRVFQELITRPT